MRVGVVIASLSAAVTLAAPAQAYVRSRSPDGTVNIIWPDPRITMTVRTGGTAVLDADAFVAAVARAAATWSDPALETSVDVNVTRSGAAPSDPAFDQQNTISFRTSGWDPPTYQPTELALTTVWVQGGRIVDADIEINAADPRFRWDVLADDPFIASLSHDIDLQNALTHELGHVLGLDHPCYLEGPPDPPEFDDLGAPMPSCSDPALPASVPLATMYPSSTGGNIEERTLSDDEVLALRDLYPAGQAPFVEGPLLSEPGGCAAAGDAHPSGSSWLGALAATALVARARRRPRR